MPQPGDSFLSNPDASGVELPTVLIGGKEYPVVMVAPPDGHFDRRDIYVASAIAMAAAVSKNYLSLFNADAALKVHVLSALILVESSAGVVGLARGHRLFRFTAAHSVGTAVTVRKLDTTLGALDADITARANGQTVPSIEAEALAGQTVNEEESGAGGVGSTPALWPPPFALPNGETPVIVLNPNEGVVIQNDAVAGVGNRSAFIYFVVR